MPSAQPRRTISFRTACRELIEGPCTADTTPPIDLAPKRRIVAIHSRVDRGEGPTTVQMSKPVRSRTCWRHIWSPQCHDQSGLALCDIAPFLYKKRTGTALARCPALTTIAWSAIMAKPKLLVLIGGVEHIACTKCQSVKPRTPEHFYPRGDSDFRRQCKTCERVRMVSQETNASEVRNQRKRSARMIRGEEIRTREVERRAAQRDKVNEQSRHYYERKAEQSPGHQRKRVAAWRSGNPERAAQLNRLSSRLRRARERGAPGSHTQDDIDRLLSAQKRKCWWCAKPLRGYHVDHRIPLARGGSNGADNLVISCPRCNQRKHAKMPWEFEVSRLL